MERPTDRHQGRTSPGTLASPRRPLRRRPADLRVPLDGRPGRPLVHRAVRRRGHHPQANHPRHPLPRRGQRPRTARQRRTQRTRAARDRPHRFARSLPSLYQLLPEYACIEHCGDLAKTTEATIPELDTAMTADAMRFHTQLQDAEAARPASLSGTHAIVGNPATTPTTIKIANGLASPLPPTAAKTWPATPPSRS